MAIQIKYNDPRQDPEGLREGVTLTPIKSEFRDHYRVFAHNEDYPNRTELGTVKRVGDSRFVVEVEHKNWACCGFTVNQKSYGIERITSARAAVEALYNHRMQLRKEGLINEH